MATLIAGKCRRCACLMRDEREDKRWECPNQECRHMEFDLKEGDEGYDAVKHTCWCPSCDQEREAQRIGPYSK